MVKSEYYKDKIKVQEIANHIEMMPFKRFILNSQIFYEEYGKPTHPDFIHEKKIIDEITKINFGKKIPNDLANWCIRFDINREELVLKSMKLEKIIIMLRKMIPEIFIIHTPETSKKIMIRCYIRNSMIKSTIDYYHTILLPLLDKIKNVIIRGIDGIKSTYIMTIIKNLEQKDGSLKREKIYAISTVGTNLREILNNKYIDPYNTYSDSIREMEKIFGIAATRNKILCELSDTMDLSKVHCSIFADEMTRNGSITSIQKTGLKIREPGNLTLQMSFETPVQVIRDAAINGLNDEIGGISGPLILGTNPKIGTTYNRLCVNTEFINKKENLENLLDEL